MGDRVLVAASHGDVKTARTDDVIAGILRVVPVGVRGRRNESISRMFERGGLASAQRDSNDVRTIGLNGKGTALALQNKCLWRRLGLRRNARKDKGKTRDELKDEQNGTEQKRSRWQSHAFPKA